MVYERSRRENLNLDKQSKRKILSQNVKIQNEDFDVLVLDVIRISMTSELKISDAWFTSIDKGALDTLKSLDFLVLLLLYDLPNKRKSVESLVKTKIRNGKITQELVKKCFANHAKILRSEFESLQNIAENLMNSQEKILNYFSMVFHVQAFAHLDRFCQQEIIADLATQIGTNPKTRDIALDTLKELSKNHTELLAKFSFYISGFLDHVINLNLSQVRQIMDILSTLAYNSPHLGQVLRDDLHMVIRKQITANSKSTLKQIGVIGAVAVVKNMCKISSVDAFKSSENGQGSSSGRSNLINQALEVLEMVKRATKTFGSVSGLFMDELACIFDGEHDLHSELLDWISDKMANDFQDEFVVDVSQEEMEGKIVHDFLPFKLLFAIEDPALEDNIGLNLSQIVAKGGNFATKASRLIPHFRLMSKCIGKQQNGHLDDIDAVLGCPIWMVSEEIYDKCESLSTRELSVLCDINFFCLNFFRELINTFSGSSISEDRNKVLIRLKNMLRIEENLEKILPFHSGYVPPIMLHLEDLSAWNSPIVQNETGKGKGNKKKRKAGQDITNCDNNGDDSTIQNEVENCPKIDLAAFAPFFREFDLSVFKILTFNILTIGSQDEDEPKLRPKEFLVLIKDLNMKLSHVLVTTKKGFPGKMKQSYGFSNLDHLEALHIVKFTISLMENILADGEVVAEYFKNILDLYDGNTESQELYKDDHFGDFNACLEQVFQSLVTLMTWNGFENQVELYKKALKNLNRLNKTDKDSLKDLSLKALEYLSKFQGAILKASVADSHLKLMEAANFGNENSNLIHLAGKNYLSRKWFCAGKSAEKGAKFHGYIENFLTSFLNHCQDDFEALKIIEEIVNEGLMSMVENQENRSQFVTLNKNTLPVYFKAILNSLVSIVSKKRSNEDKLEVWMTSTELFQKMMLDVVKKMASPRAILGPLLKASRPFLDLFLKQGMSMMDKVFNRQRDDCIGLLKSMQLCTRYLQHVCSFSRQKLDVGLAAQVPPLRKLLEQFVYRVKAMLALNNALEAFWLGNLKHRDLQGKELDSSQIVDEDEEEIVDEPDEESENEKENEVEEEESLEY